MTGKMSLYDSIGARYGHNLDLRRIKSNRFLYTFLQRAMVSPLQPTKSSSIVSGLNPRRTICSVDEYIGMNDEPKHGSGSHALMQSSSSDSRSDTKFVGGSTDALSHVCSAVEETGPLPILPSTSNTTGCSVDEFMEVHSKEDDSPMDVLVIAGRREMTSCIDDSNICSAAHREITLAKLNRKSHSSFLMPPDTTDSETEDGSVRAPDGPPDVIFVMTLYSATDQQQPPSIGSRLFRLFQSNENNNTVDRVTV